MNCKAGTVRYYKHNVDRTSKAVQDEKLPSSLWVAGKTSCCGEGESDTHIFPTKFVVPTRFKLSQWPYPTSQAVAVWEQKKLIVFSTLQGTNISPNKALSKIIFLFPWWTMLVPGRVRTENIWNLLLGSSHPVVKGHQWPFHAKMSCSKTATILEKVECPRIPGLSPNFNA